MINSSPLPQIFGSTDIRFEIDYSVNDPESNPDEQVVEEQEPILIYQLYSDENGPPSDIDDPKLETEFSLNFGSVPEDNSDNAEGPALILVNESESERQGSVFCHYIILRS